MIDCLIFFLFKNLFTMNQRTSVHSDTSFSTPADAHLMVQKYSYSYNKTYKKDIQFIHLLFPDFTHNSCTLYISVFLIVVYAFAHGYFFRAHSPLSIDITKQYYLGLNRYFISDKNQWYRIITASFFHSNIWSLLINIYFFMNLGIITERKYGSWKYFLYLLLSTLWGNLATVACSKCIQVYMGISSILTGHIGIYLAEIITYYRNLVDPLSVSVNFIYTTFMLLLMTTTMIHNGNMFGNIGGILAGLCYEYIFHNKSNQSPSVKKWRIGFIIFSVVYVILCLAAITFSKCATDSTYIPI